ncbi:P-loop containing nucleoside triphosphate hydrolase protein [Fimicolochytrium jonesii]|uniref:P-loop containing nucleoside triphosphate hydrolase protein n=1 Tax=Fimicolochytrium jonesii TaxID=1396493 RepID=UPI0022FF1C06|nr:P-loop containing nucleoside triphosphate hydrolase protein [Fimicolochytrium jonesii]KAI8821127.1 P-loop containing nucleoside triphosphate hydrolase protein [Fimicolochytrium jonesii]
MLASILSRRRFPRLRQPIRRVHGSPTVGATHLLSILPPTYAPDPASVNARPEYDVGEFRQPTKLVWRNALNDPCKPASLDAFGTTDFEPSEEQQAILDHVRGGTSDVVVLDAKAGTGKTTTLLRTLLHMPSTCQNVAILAYNKVNADLIAERAADIKKRHELPFSITARTFHGAGLDAWTEYIRGDASSIHVNPEKSWQIFQAMLTWDAIMLYGNEVAQLVSMAKMHCLAPEHASLSGITVPDTPDAWKKLMTLYDIKCKPDAKEDKLIDIAQKCLRRSLQLAGGLQDGNTFFRRRLATTTSALLQDLRGIEDLQTHNAQLAFELHHGDGMPNMNEFAKRQLDMAITACRRSRFVLDYDDMLYLPLVHGAPFPKYDHVLVDEAQDMSHARAAAVQKMCAPGGRLLLFGDNRQRIYQFAGATRDWFSEMHDEGLRQAGISVDAPYNSANSTNLGFGLPLAEHPRRTYTHDANLPVADDTQTSNASKKPWASVTLLPLSVTRRCPQLVVKLAQTLVPEIQSAPNAIEGEIVSEPKFELAEFFRGETTMVLARNNLPILNFAYYLMAHDFRVQVPGRHIGEDVMHLLEFACTTLEVKDTDWTDDLAAKLYLFRESLTADTLEERVGEKLAIGGLEAFDDRLDSIMTILTYCVGRFSHSRSVLDLKKYLLYRQNDPPDVILTTFHKSRGLEMDNVVILNQMDHIKKFDSSHRRTFRNQDTEENLMYIAYTRARRRLRFMEWLPEGQHQSYEYVRSRDKCPLTGHVVEHRIRPYVTTDLLERVEMERDAQEALRRNNTPGLGMSSRELEMLTEMIEEHVAKKRVGCAPGLTG